MVQAGRSVAQVMGNPWDVRVRGAGEWRTWGVATGALRERGKCRRVRGESERSTRSFCPLPLSLSSNHGRRARRRPRVPPAGALLDPVVRQPAVRVERERKRVLSFFSACRRRAALSLPRPRPHRLSVPLIPTAAPKRWPPGASPCGPSTPSRRWKSFGGEFFCSARAAVRVASPFASPAPCGGAGEGAAFAARARPDPIETQPEALGVSSRATEADASPERRRPPPRSSLSALLRPAARRPGAGRRSDSDLARARGQAPQKRWPRRRMGGRGPRRAARSAASPSLRPAARSLLTSPSILTPPPRPLSPSHSQPLQQHQAPLLALPRLRPAPLQSGRGAEVGGPGVRARREMDGLSAQGSLFKAGAGHDVAQPPARLHRRAVH